MFGFAGVSVSVSTWLLRAGRGSADYTIHRALIRVICGKRVQKLCIQIDEVLPIFLVLCSVMYYRLCSLTHSLTIILAFVTSQIFGKFDK